MQLPVQISGLHLGGPVALGQGRGGSSLAGSLLCLPLSHSLLLVPLQPALVSHQGLRQQASVNLWPNVTDR